MKKKQFKKPREGLVQNIFITNLLFMFISIVVSCANEKVSQQVEGKQILLVVATDYESGALSAINLENNQTFNNLFALNQDSVLNEIDGIPYILERGKADNIKRLDKNNNFKVVYEESLRKTSNESVNPHDIAKINEKTALVSTYNLRELRVVNLDNGKLTDTTIDISSYSSDASPPDVSQLLRVDNFIYAGLHDLSESIFEPQRSRLLKVNTSNLSITALEIPFKNLSNRLQLYSSGGVKRIIGAGLGSYLSATDGGIVSYNIDTNSFDTPTFREEVTSSATGTKGKNLKQVIYVNDTKAFALLANNSYKDFIVVFNPRTQIITQELLGETNGGSYYEMLISNGKIFISDRNLQKPGIRIFNVETLREITTNGPINVGLPPASMKIIERN